MTISLSTDNPIALSVRRVRERIAEQCAAVGRDPAEVRLMAVTKTVSPARVNQAIAAGVTLLGENRAQELCAKYEAYDKDCAEIHFIGRLQSNKVRQVIDKVTMVHSLDSLSLAWEISRQCEKRGKAMDCLVQVNIGREQSKAGILPEALEDFLCESAQIPYLRLCGLMAIPPVCENEQDSERYFSAMRQLFVDNREKKIDNVNMEILSMGMSGDYLSAIKHGSNLVRLGSVLFGQRNSV